MSDLETQLTIERNRLAEYERDLIMFRQASRDVPAFFADAVQECRERIVKLETQQANERKQGRLFT